LLEYGDIQLKRWIRSVLFQHWITGILLLTLAASYSWYSFFQIKWKTATRQADEYTQLYTADCPAMLLTNNGITFDPPIYKFITSTNQLTLIFAPNDTTQVLPTNARRGSLLFTPGSLTYRGRKKDHHIQLGDGNVKADSLYISSEKLHEFVSKKRSFLDNLIFLIGWLCLVITALILGVITAAIFMGIDLLTRERLNWSTGYNLASIILFFLWFLWILQHQFNWNFPTIFAVFLILFILLSGIGLTLIRNFEPDTFPRKDKKE
ncbi:hypothetical protein KAH55_06410, partial [bacterium]|nr:hypothetical protein [bacterium]